MVTVKIGDKLCGEGWVAADPPLQRDDGSVVARCNGHPIKAGFRTETVEDSDEEFHVIYRTGVYDVELRLDFLTGETAIKVERAEGYATQTA